MKEAELRKRATCSRCNKKLGETGSPVFAVVRQQDYIINLEAVRRQDGLGQMLGDGRLAMHMGPNEEMATPAPEAVDVTLCALCRCQFEGWLNDG